MENSDCLFVAYINGVTVYNEENGYSTCMYVQMYVCSIQEIDYLDQIWQ